MPNDMLNLSTADIVNSPDVRSWPCTAALTRVSFENGQTSVEFSKKDGPGRWPDGIPPGWEGPLQYTLWLFVHVGGGTWCGSGFVQFWHGRAASGTPGDPDVPSRYHANWYYGTRWRPINGHGQIQPGEEIGFMVTSGNARDSVGPFGPQERSNVVVFRATDNGTFDFPAEAPPVPVPVPVPTPVPTPVPVPVPPTPAPAPVDLTGVLARLAALELTVQKIPTGVTASGRLFGVTVPIDCQLVFEKR
jgi:hypothetical protein